MKTERIISNGSINKNYISNLPLKILAPLAAAIVFILLLLTFSIFYFEAERLHQTMLEKRVTHTQTSAQDFYQKSIIADARALTSIIDTLKLNTKLEEIFVSYDRKVLLEYTEKLFRELKRDFNITHFYFTKPDRTNLLRVHVPERYGDRIDRLTTMQAEHNGTNTYGVELGVLGSFTLRVVSPWYDKQTGQLIGYIELGMEMDHVMNRLRDMLGLDIIIVVNKKYLDRDEWEKGMRLLGRTPDWERFDQVVLSADSPKNIPDSLSERYKISDIGHSNNKIELQRDGSYYRLLTITLEDFGGRPVSEMAILSDVTFEMNIPKRIVLIGSIMAFVIGGILIALFYWLTDRIGQRIDQDEKILKQLATQDELTGLFNRRIFNEFLDEEIDRSTRFNHPMSLLFLDIDHFKRINDDYGHQVGDEVLKELSKRLTRDARIVDRIYRYGGEEITIILPEADTQTASKAANRILSLVESVPFEISDGQLISITVSIGVASYPMHADTGIFLLSAADKAMYAAKQGGRNRVVIFNLSE